MWCLSLHGKMQYRVIKGSVPAGMFSAVEYLKYDHLWCEILKYGQRTLVLHLHPKGRKVEQSVGKPQ